MHEISVQSDFRAAHAITMGRIVEDSHEHDWHVEVVIAGETLDDDGLLCDFHVVERELGRVLDPFRDGDFNRTPPFHEINPTAENIARHIAERLDTALAESLGERASVAAVTITEAPGCRARYLPCRVRAPHA